MVFGIIPGVGSYLHLHHVLGDIELQIPFCVDRNGRKRNHILVGRHLEQHPVVQVQGSQDYILGQGGAQYAHRRVVLAHHPGRIEIDVVAEQGISGFGSYLPPRDGEPCLDLCRGYLAEIIVPLVVVGEIVLVIELRLLETGLEVYSQRHRTLAGPPERIERQAGIGLDAHIVLLLAEEYIFTLGIPLDIFPKLAFHSGVYEAGVPYGVVAYPQVGRVEGVEIEDAVPDASVQPGHYGFLRPRL